MKKAEKTIKDVFVTALEELLEERPLEKITVSSITKHCKMPRRSFYNYFTDINDLVLYTHTQVEDAIALVLPKKRTTHLSATMFYAYAREHKLFYERALSYKGRNSLYHMLYENSLKYCIANLEESELTPDIITALKFYCNGTVFIFKQWVKAGMIEEPEVMAERIFNCHPIALDKYKR